MSRKVEFTKDFDYSPTALNGHRTVAYKKGDVDTVNDEAFEAATAAGAVKEVSETKGKVKASEDAGGQSK